MLKGKDIWKCNYMLATLYIAALAPLVEIMYGIFHRRVLSVLCCVGIICDLCYRTSNRAGGGMVARYLVRNFFKQLM